MLYNVEDTQLNENTIVGGLEKIILRLGLKTKSHPVARNNISGVVITYTYY